jgi:hypothetical protein
VSGEFTLLIVCCVWPFVGVLVGWGLRGAVEKRRAQRDLLEGTS